MIKVTKFGGSSLADAAQFQKVAEIIRADAARKYVVPSAPGKRFKNDDKVTDLLYKSYALSSSGQDTAEVFGEITQRYTDIKNELGLTTDIESIIAQVKKKVDGGASIDYTASRGEYLNGILLAEYLDFAFIDAAEIILFDSRGVLDADKTNTIMSKRLAREGARRHSRLLRLRSRRRHCDLLPRRLGYHRFPCRPGSQGDLYENWTDVSGFMVTDPRIVPETRVIRYITYKELRELSYMGASVLHQDAVFPVAQSGIPINIRNTNEPDALGTMIVHQLPKEHQSDTVITGIAGHKGYCAITIEKNMMNSELGIGRRFLEIFERNNILFEHLPSGVDTMSAVLNAKAIEGKRESVMTSIQDEIEPDSIEFIPNLALLAVVGHGMASNVGTAGKIFSALGQQNINVRIIDQGSSEINIIIGVDECNLEKSIRTIYDAFAREELL